MEPFLVTIQGPLVPTSRVSAHLGISILPYFLLFFSINCYSSLVTGSIHH